MRVIGNKSIFSDFTGFIFQHELFILSAGLIEFSAFAIRREALENVAVAFARSLSHGPVKRLSNTLFKAVISCNFFWKNSFALSEEYILNFPQGRIFAYFLFTFHIIISLLLMPSLSFS
jgi:hypothetical protein